MSFLSEYVNTTHEKTYTQRDGERNEREGGKEIYRKRGMMDQCWRERDGNRESAKDGDIEVNKETERERERRERELEQEREERHKEREDAHSICLPWTQAQQMASTHRET